MKKITYLFFFLICLGSHAQLINEFQPNPDGTDPSEVPVEIKGNPGEAFSGFLLSIENDGVSGTVDRAAEASGTFDSNGLLVVNIPDLENPSFTFVLCSLNPGVGTDLDADDDGTIDDLSTMGTVYDAIGIPDNAADAAVSYGLSLGQAFTYTQAEPALVFRDGSSNSWFAINSTDNIVYDLSANPVELTYFDTTPAYTGTFGAVNPIYSLPTEPTISIDSPDNNEVFSPGTSTVEITYTVLNPTGTSSVDITVNGNLITDISDNPYVINTSDGETYNITIEMVDGGVLASDQVTFSVSDLVQVNSISELRTGNIGSTYQLTNEVFITYMTSFRNQKHIEDATGGILIDDSSSTITTSFEIADGITGLIGTLGEFNGTMQFVPTEDPGNASSNNNALSPQEVTLSELSSNAENYESELVKVTNVTMDNTDSTFMGGLEIVMSQGSDSFNFRTAFNEDYSSASIPSVATDITGVILDRSGNYFLMARNSSDFSADILSNLSNLKNRFKLYPNPVSNGTVTITSQFTEAITATVFDILGKEVIKERINNNTLDVSQLNKGIYLMKLTQNGASATQKLVIK